MNSARLGQEPLTDIAHEVSFRSPGPHVQGCLGVDLLSGKEETTSQQ